MSTNEDVLKEKMEEEYNIEIPNGNELRSKLDNKLKSIKTKP